MTVFFFFLFIYAICSVPFQQAFSSSYKSKSLIYKDFQNFKMSLNYFYSMTHTTNIANNCFNNKGIYHSLFALILIDFFFFYNEKV